MESKITLIVDLVGLVPDEESPNVRYWHDVFDRPLVAADFGTERDAGIAAERLSGLTKRTLAAYAHASHPDLVEIDLYYTFAYEVDGDTEYVPYGSENVYCQET